MKDKADWLAYILVVSMPLVSLLSIFKITEINGLSLRPIDILFLCSFYLWSLRIIKMGYINKKLVYMIVCICAYLFITLLGGLFTYENRFDAAKFARFMQTLLWGLFGISFINNEKRLNRLLANIITSGVILAFSSIFIFFAFNDLHRIGGFISFAGGEESEQRGSYNEIGALYALIISIFLWKFYTGLFRKLDLINLLIIIFGLILVQSRSSLVAVALVIIFLLSFDILKLSAGKLDKKSILMIICILLTIIVSLYLSQYLTINRLTDSFDPNASASSSTAIRFYLWEKSFSLITEGIGTLFIGHGNALFMRELGSASSDNFYLDSVISVGLFGTVIILAIIFIPSISVWKAGHYSRNLCLGVLVSITVLTVSLTGNVIVDPMYGGISFLLLYSIYSVYYPIKN